MRELMRVSHETIQPIKLSEYVHDQKSLSFNAALTKRYVKYIKICILIVNV